MRALRTTLTVALLSQTFVAAWKGSPVELELSFKMGWWGGLFVMVLMCVNGQSTTGVSIRRPCR